MNLKALYMHKITLLTCSGYVPDDLATAKIGVMHHARWLTLASRILRYYVSDPVVRTEEVETLARYIVRVYYKVCTTQSYHITTSDHFIDKKFPDIPIIFEGPKRKLN